MLKFVMTKSRQAHRIPTFMCGLSLGTGLLMLGGSGCSGSATPAGGAGGSTAGVGVGGSTAGASAVQGGTHTGGVVGTSGGAVAAGTGGNGGTGGSGLTDRNGLICGTDQQVVKVVSPALGTTQCACVASSSTGPCTDCTCGASLCAQFAAHCVGFALEGGLGCTQNG